MKKRTRVKLPKFYKEVCPECGDLNIFFDGIMKIECKNCHFMLARGGTSVALDKEGCGIPQDLEIFFRELDIY
jgi:ribosomal protein S27E